MFLSLSNAMFKGVSASEEPAPFDILCGKDKTYNKHKGNMVFREMIASHQDVYAKAASKQGKMQITKDIVKALRAEHNSRFVKLNKGGKWVEISDQVARDKVSHALRFAAKSPKPDLPFNPCGKCLTRRYDPVRGRFITVTPPVRNYAKPAGGEPQCPPDGSCCQPSYSYADSTESTSSQDDDSECDLPTNGKVDDVHVNAVANSIFARQQAILNDLRSKIAELQAADRGVGRCNNKSSTQELEEMEFDVLRSEDFEDLLREPNLFTATSQEWANAYVV